MSRVTPQPTARTLAQKASLDRERRDRRHEHPEGRWPAMAQGKRAMTPEYKWFPAGRRSPPMLMRSVISGACIS